MDTDICVKRQGKTKRISALSARVGRTMYADQRRKSATDVANRAARYACHGCHAQYRFSEFLFGYIEQPGHTDGHTDAVHQTGLPTLRAIPGTIVGTRYPIAVYGQRDAVARCGVRASKDTPQTLPLNSLLIGVSSK